MEDSDVAGAELHLGVPKFLSHGLTGERVVTRAYGRPSMSEVGGMGHIWNDTP